MKKSLLLITLMLCAMFSFSQRVDDQEKARAQRLIETNKTALGYAQVDMNDIIIHTSYQVPSSDIQMVYLQQSYKGIPVYNQIQVLAFKNGKVVSNTGGLLTSMQERTKNHGGNSSIPATTAVQTALSDRQLPGVSISAPLSVTDNGRKFDFGKLGLTSENIQAELLWLPIHEGKEVKLVWQVFITPLTSSDYWLIRVDASSNTVIDKQNLTVTCNWDHGNHSVQEHFEKKHVRQADKTNYVLQQDQKTKQWQYRPYVVNNAAYRVIQYPAESPEAAGGTPAIHNNPWAWAPGNATSLGWHFDGVTYYESSRGNNAWAYEDADNNNVPGTASNSTTVQPDLTFTPTPDFTLAPTTAANQQFNITNLFYWNNLMHDVFYVYGFTEATRNFQADNQGRGGSGNDYVLAEAQDGGGSNNANFATPADGSRPRMQMYLWNMNGASPIRDGDVDNSVIAHEYGHGISNRLTGSGSGCLGNGEHMGEGWSDFFALMVTTNWATATPTDGFTIPRPIGKYALNNGPLFGTPGNAGIRHYPYSTNLVTNPVMYGATISSSPHDRGEIWASVLWDMTWNIINHPGVGINPNLFDPGAGGGNAIALKLVVEGLRLQPCGPGFIDGRNAILKADTLFFGAQYSCDIIRAFARRGMGLGASQGSATSVTDQIVSFNDGSSFTLTQNAPTVMEGNNIVYTNTVTAACVAIVNHTLTDTLPNHVTYVSGGTYDPGTRVVSFPVNVAAETSQPYSFTVNVNAGSYFPPAIHINDPVTTIAPNWTATSTSANVWSVSNTSSQSAPSSFFSPDAAVLSDQILRTTASFAIPNNPSATSTLRFSHRYVTESTFDGAVVELSINGGGSWVDLGPYMTGLKYNGTISNSFSSPIGGRQAFTGTSGAAFQETKVNLSAFAGQNVIIRFRFASDISVGSTGWFVDDIFLTSEPVVYMKSTLFDASMIPVSTSDTTTLILPNGACVDPAITGQPASVVNCSVTGNGVFTVVATGSSLSYQWDVSTDGGTVWTPVPAATGSTYTLVNPTTALNGNLYRVTVTGTCGTPVTSIAAVLYVSPALTHSAVTATPDETCAPGVSAITGTVSGGTAAPDAVVGSTGVINMGIPDNTPAGLSSSIALPAMSIQQAANLKIRLNLTHTHVGDLSVTLTSPCGTTFVFDRPGVPASPNGNSGNLSGSYTFDLSGATILPEAGGGTIATGTYQPSDNGAPGAAHTWAGLTFPCGTEGAWTINIVDNAGLDIGTLNEWQILTGGNYTHTLTGPGTITQGASTGANNSTGNFNVTALPGGSHTFTLTSYDVLGCSVSSDVTVLVNTVPTITTHPASDVICAGDNASFNVVDNSALPPSYQWQIDQGSGFVDLLEVAPFSGVTTPTLTVTGASTTYNGSVFRVVITNGCGTETSNTATLTINPLPVIVVAPDGECAPVELTASGADTYVWTPSLGLGGTTGATVTANPTSTTVYTVTGTLTATGCENTATVTVLGTPAPIVVTPATPVICEGSLQQLSVPSSTATFTYSGSTLNIPGTGTGGAAGSPASVYPAAINVSGLPTTGVTVASVTINGITHTFPDDIDVLLSSPTGTNVVLMSDVGGLNDFTNNNFTFRDDALVVMSDAGANASGTYRPTNFVTPDTWPAPGPGSFAQANPALSMFSGDPNGNWNLFVTDDLGGDFGSMTSWSITFNVNTVQWAPATGLFLDAAGTVPYTAGTFTNTVYAGPATTTTYNLTSTLGTCSADPVSVTVTVNPAPTFSVTPDGQCGPVLLTASGTANTYAWSPANGLSATTGASVTANPGLNTVYTVTGTITATGCTATRTVSVNARPASPVITPSSATICLNSAVLLTIQPTSVTTPNSAGPILIPAGAPGNTAAGVASPYPVTLSVGGLPISGVRVKSVTLNNVSHTFPDDIDIVLRSPSGVNVVLLSDVGGSVDFVNATFVFDDAGPLMSDGGANPSGTYHPTNFGASDTWVAPGPGAITQGSPALSMFTGDLNGNWQLFVVDDLGGDVGSIGSWNVTFETVGAIWTPVTGLFTNVGLTVPYVAGTVAGTVFASPATATTYTASIATAVGACTTTPTTVAITVVLPITITTQPANQVICQNGNATFSVVAGGNFQNYQWQISTNSGVAWTNIAGANNASLVISNAATTLSGNQYRVIVSNSCTTVTSAAATLTVNAITPVTVLPLNNRICISDTLVGLTGTPIGGSWSGIGVSGNNFVPGATAVGTYTLTYSYANASGCVSSATVVAKVEDCPERLILLRDDAVILFPNPNNGQFNIRINSTLYNYLAMRVYNSAGQLLKIENFGGLVFGRVIPIDLTTLPGGIYMVKFYYDDGVRTSEKSFKVVVGR